jgi:hypothetical protein
MLEKQVNQIYGKRANLDAQIIAIEGASVNRVQLDAMREGDRALRAAVKET